jgi:hypothetical protein
VFGFALYPLLLDCRVNLAFFFHCFGVYIGGFKDFRLPEEEKFVLRGFGIRNLFYTVVRNLPIQIPEMVFGSCFIDVH